MLARFLGRPCRACGRRSRLRRLGAVAPTHPGPFHTQDFSLMLCPRCEVVYLDPAPTAADLRTLYEESAQFDDPHYTDAQRIAEIVEYCTDAIRRLDLLPPPGGRALEVGAGYAWVSRACKRLDDSITTTAQDVSGEVAEKCAWVDHYHVGALSTLADREPFHLASMTHVIEHLVDPAAMLAALSARLAPGAKLFVTAPHRPSGWLPKAGIAGWHDYSYLHVPAHVTYFSRKWFEQMAPRHGLAVAHWDASHENGQAFELVLRRAS
jgi:SAM-dependent methyltransferase